MSVNEIERRIREAIQPTPVFISTSRSSKVVEPSAKVLVSGVELLNVFGTASDSKIMASENSKAHPSEGMESSSQMSISHLLELLKPDHEDEETNGLTPPMQKHRSTDYDELVKLVSDEHTSASTSNAIPNQSTSSVTSTLNSRPSEKSISISTNAPPQKSQFSQWLKKNRNSKNAIVIPSAVEPTNIPESGAQMDGNGPESSAALRECATFNTAIGEEEMLDGYENAETEYYEEDNDDLLACLAQFSEAGDWWDGRERLRDCGGPWWDRALLDDEPSDTGFDSPSWRSADARPPPPRFRSVQSNKENIADRDGSSLAHSSPKVPWPRPRNDAQPRGGWGFLAIPKAPVAPREENRANSSIHRAGRWGGEGCGPRRYYKTSTAARRHHSSSSSSSNIKRIKEPSVNPSGFKTRNRKPKPVGSQVGEDLSTWAPCWGIMM